MELSRMALAAMDSEPVEMPLDYLRGHKDGLEWAAQLAESNHPQTGDWLYDDPIELAKAIRKGPDMPPAQPVADSEPERNPVLGYADSYRDMAKQGVESVPIWSVITDLERNIAPLYRHAQPAPVVPDVMEPTIEAIKRILPTSNPDEYAACIGADMWNACRAAILQAGNSPAQAECTTGFESYLERAGRSDSTSVIAISLVSIARRTAGLLRQLDFKPNEESENPIEVLLFDAEKVESEIKEMKKSRAAMLAAAPQSSGSEPITVPGKWIPVSERMPEVGDIVLTAMGGAVNVGEMECSAANCRFFTSVISGRELPATHWMPLPAGPKEDIKALIPLVSRNEQEGK
ncbi:DUF551 domain-containing protein [Klebsiella pneumoniae]|nr:DUF551 domain-containing protein [Klebsiella pneumoniae]